MSKSEIITVGEWLSVSEDRISGVLEQDTDLVIFPSLSNWGALYAAFFKKNSIRTLVISDQFHGLETWVHPKSTDQGSNSADGSAAWEMLQNASYVSFDSDEVSDDASERIGRELVSLTIPNVSVWSEDQVRSRYRAMFIGWIGDCDYNSRPRQFAELLSVTGVPKARVLFLTEKIPSYSKFIRGLLPRSVILESWTRVEQLESVFSWSAFSIDTAFLRDNTFLAGESISFGVPVVSLYETHDTLTSPKSGGYCAHGDQQALVSEVKSRLLDIDKWTETCLLAREAASKRRETCLKKWRRFLSTLNG